MSEAAPHNARNDLNRLVNWAKGLIALEEEVSKYGGLEQAIAESQHRLDGLQVQERHLDEVIAEKVSASERELAAHKAAADAHAENVRVEAETVIANAAAQAKDIIAAAEEEAARVKADASALISTHAEIVKTAQASHEAIAAAIEEKKLHLSELEGAISSRSAEHEALKREHEEFLSKIGARS